MNEFTIYLQAVLIYLSGVFLSAVAQIILKKEASREHKNVIMEYLNPGVIIGYGITFGCTLLTLAAYSRGLKVSWANVLESTGYVFVTFLGVTILKEKITYKKLISLGIILTGVVMFALGGK